MRSSIGVRSTAAFVILCCSLAGQCNLTSTVNTSTSGVSLMFDVVNLTQNVVRVTSLDMFVSTAVSDLQIWAVTCGGTMVGKHATPGAWTQVANFQNITGLGSGTMTVLPAFPVPLDLLPGTTGIYIFRTSGSPHYQSSPAVTLGQVIASDANLQIQAGYGLSANFVTVATPTTYRAWPGRFNYDCVSPGPPPASEFQTNQPGATLLVNNAAGGSCAATVVTQSVYACTPPVPATGTIALSSNNLGMPWELVMSNANLVGASGGGVTLPDGEVINLNFGSTLTFLNNFFGSTLPGGFPGQAVSGISFGYGISTQFDASFQAGVLNPASITGLDLSQATELHVNLLAVPATFAGPTADNATVALNVTTQPTCWFPGGIPFYGTLYNTVHITSNGRIMFGAAGDTDTTATVAEGLTDIPFVGLWRDFNPALGPGTITASNPGPGILRVDYAVRDAGEAAGPVSTFGIQIDTGTGYVTIDGLNTVAANPQTVYSATIDAAFLGITNGSAGSTNPGASTLFAPTGTGFPANATDMWYDFYSPVNPGPGLPASLVPGTLTSIIFAPDATYPTNYMWTGY